MSLGKEFNIKQIMTRTKVLLCQDNGKVKKYFLVLM